MMTREEENARIRERYRAARGGKLQTVRSQDEPDDDEVGGGTPTASRPPNPSCRPNPRTRWRTPIRLRPARRGG